MLKKLLALSLCVFSAQAMLTDHTKEHIKHISGYVKPGMYRDEQGFSVMKDGKRTRVNMYDVERSLRAMEVKRLRKMSNYITAHKMTNGDITLRLSPKLHGGNILGATVGWWTGYIGTNLVAQAGIGLCSFGSASLVMVTTGNPLLAGAAAKSTYTALNTSLQPAIQIAANKVALASGAALGVATGPVG